MESECSVCRCVARSRHVRLLHWCVPFYAFEFLYYVDVFVHSCAGPNGLLTFVLQMIWLRCVVQTHKNNDNIMNMCCSVLLPSKVESKQSTSFCWPSTEQSTQHIANGRSASFSFNSSLYNFGHIDFSARAAHEAAAGERAQTPKNINYAFDHH